MGWTEVWQYSNFVKCPLGNQYFASYIAIRAIYFERICTYLPMGMAAGKSAASPLEIPELQSC